MQLNYTHLLQHLWGTPRSPSPSPPADLPSNDPADSTQDIADFLEEAGQFLWQEVLSAQVPHLHNLPTSLPQTLQTALREQGIEQLYSHQLKALHAIRAGRDVVLTPPTAAGKTLAAYIGILEGCLNQEFRCLAFYGLKALAADQTSKLNGLIGAMPAQHRPRFVQMTGDTSKAERERLLSTQPHVIALTPDLFHYQLKAVWRSSTWQQFLQQLRYVLVDEMHTYSGVYGANMALLLKRLKLAIDRYGGNSDNLQFIFLSATCGNPAEFARQLSGRKRTKAAPKRLVWIRQSGAATAEKRLIVTQPTYNPNPETARLMVYLLRQGRSGITFCNARDTTKTIAQLIHEECRLQGCEILANQVVTFYGSLTDQRRRDIIAQIESGQIRWIVATEALEAGIDLPVLDCCIVRGFPGSLMSFWQRMGRVGRRQAGLAIYLPMAQNPIDLYYAEREHLFGDMESIAFNDRYPILLTKHLRCAAAESGIPVAQLKHYFGTAAIPIAQLLLEQGYLSKGQSGLYTRGFPHRELNFRGGSLERSFTLVDTASGKELEVMNEAIAYREVHPDALYRLQQENGQLRTYRCQALDLTTQTAQLEPISETPLFTVIQSQKDVRFDQPLIDPIQVPLVLPEHLAQQEQVPDQAAPIAQLQIELAWGELAEVVTGYTLMTRLYERTCLNRKCLHYKEALPADKRCPSCGKLLRQAEITKTIAEKSFEQPYRTQFVAPVVKVSLDPLTQTCLRQTAQMLRASFNGQAVPKGYEQLWECPATFIGLHTFGHQLMLALPLVVKADRREINFLVHQEASGQLVGLFFDQSDGGNGASENLVRHLAQVAQVAAGIANRQTSHSIDYLYQFGCPDGNKALIPELGLVLLNGIRSNH